MKKKTTLVERVVVVSNLWGSLMRRTGEIGSLAEKPSTNEDF